MPQHFYLWGTAHTHLSVYLLLRLSVGTFSGFFATVSTCMTNVKFLRHVCLWAYFGIFLVDFMFFCRKQFRKNCFFSMSVNLPVCLSVYLSICLSVYLSICLSVYLSICLSVYLSICLSVYLSICLSVYLSICLSVYLSICLSVYLSICLCIWVTLFKNIKKLSLAVGRVNLVENLINRLLNLGKIFE